MDCVLAVCVKDTLAKTAGSDLIVTKCGLKHPRMLYIHQRKNDTDKERTEVKERAERDAVASV